MELCERRTPQIHSDARGWLWEALHAEELGARGFGVLYVVAVHPGHARGNHYHRRKTELFASVMGRLELELWPADPNSAAEFQAVELDGACPEVFVIPPGVCHRITNRFPCDAVVLAYSDEPFDPADPDTFPPPGGVLGGSL